MFIKRPAKNLTESEQELVQKLVHPRSKVVKQSPQNLQKQQQKEDLLNFLNELTV